MTEKQYIDLINKEVDGLLSEDEKHHLHKYLEKDPKAKNHYQETIRTLNLRKQVIDIDPSPNLKKNILNVIDTNLYVSEKKASTVRLSISDWVTNFNPKLAYAFTAGLIIGLLMYSVYVTETVQDHPLKNINYYGTIGIPDNANIHKLDQIPIDFPNATGVVGFYKFDNIVWFEIDITNSDQFNMSLNFDQTKINFNGYKPLANSNTFVENDKDKVTVILNADSHFLLLFNQKSAENTQIDLHIAPTTEAPFKYNFQL